MEVTEKLRQGNLICKGVLTISVAMSEYSVTVAPNWRAELECQVFSWVKDIVGGRLGAGVGTLVGGPVGAIMGGIAGSILGSLVGDDIAQSLAQWFHGGSSSRSAAELLDSALNPTSELVAEKLRTSGKGYYTHYVRAVHVSGCSSRNIAEAGPMVEEMVNDVPSETSAGTHADSEVCTFIPFSLLIFSSDYAFSLIIFINYRYSRRLYGSPPPAGTFPSMGLMPLTYGN